MAAKYGRWTWLLSLLVACAEMSAMERLKATTHMGSPECDMMEGSDDDDVMRGGDSADHLRGGRGDDVLEGGPGQDMLEGGPGKDVFALDASTLLQADTALDHEPGRDRVLLLPDLLRRLPNNLHPNVRVERGALQIRVDQRWVPVLTGLQQELAVRVNPGERSTTLQLDLRF